MSALQPRRRFFRSFLGEMASFVDEIRGRPQFRLDDLARLPEETLRGMQPVMVAGYDVVDDRLCGPAGDVVALDDVEQWIVAQFDGRKTIAAIGEALAFAFGLEPAAAERKVRVLFLALARPMICVPSGAPEET